MDDVSSQLHRVDALSGAADTPGETWLIVGSDARGGAVQDETEGARADSVMLLHKAENGQTSLTSLPRDTFVDIPSSGRTRSMPPTPADPSCWSRLWRSSPG